MRYLLPTVIYFDISIIGKIKTIYQYFTELAFEFNFLSIRDVYLGKCDSLLL